MKPMAIATIEPRSNLHNATVDNGRVIEVG